MLIWTEPSWLDWSINLCLKSILVIVVAFLLAWFFKNRPAKQRYLIWKGAFALLLLIPISGSLPSISFESYSQNIIDSQRFFETLPIPYEAAYQKSNSEFMVTVDLRNVAIPLNEPIPKPMHFSFWISFVWGIGACLFLLRILFEIFYLQKAFQKNNNALPKNWNPVLQLAKQQLHITEPTRIVISRELKIPFVFGWKKAIIVMPEAAYAWKENKIKTVLLHEVGHIRQNDFIFNFFVQIIKALYWWHPLVWIAAKETRLACEHSCDELVMQTGVSHLDYAKHLVEIARSIYHSNFQPSLTTIPIANDSQLKKRVTHILQKPDRHFYNKYFISLKYLTILILPFLFLNVNYYPSPVEQKSEQTLIQQLTHRNSATQIEAAKLLGDLQSEAAFLPLVQTLKNKDPQVRAAAVWALGQIQNKDAVSELLPLVHDQSDCVKQWTLLSLGEFGASKSFYSITETQGHSNPEVRKAMLWSLHQIGCLPAFHHISQHLDDENESVRILAKRLLEDFPKEKLRAWMMRAKNNSIKQWVYEQFSGMRREGMEALFLERLAKDGNEKELLENIVSGKHSIEVLEEIWKVLE